jgi:hypothetical protein
VDDNNNEEKTKGDRTHTPPTHLRDDYEDYDYDDNNIHIAAKKQRLKIGGLANNRGTNHQSAIPSMDGSRAG